MPNVIHNIGKLPYAYDAFSPKIGEETMRLHHQKHHKSYCDTLNELLKDEPSLIELEIEKLISEVGREDSGKMLKIRNNAGGVYNHQIWWAMMSPRQTKPGEMLLQLVKQSFGGIEALEKEFKEACADTFGSGWTWMVMRRGVVDVVSTRMQDNPLGLKSGFPVLGCDLWEHAYYLENRNRKKKWIDTFWEIINWEEVENRLHMAESYDE